MTDTGRMVLAIEGDRTGRPWVVLWGDWLHRVDVPECALALPLGDVGGVYHVHCFDPRGKLLLSLCVWRPGLLVIVLALRSLFFVFGIQLAGLFKNPRISVGMIGWFIWGAMDLAGVIEYTVQDG